MIRSFSWRLMVFATGVFLFAVSPANAQAPLLVDDFNIATGALLTDNGWTAHSGAGTNSIAAVSPGLTMTNYPGSGVGNAAGLTISGEDVNRAFPVQTSGAVYAAFLVNISDAAVDPIGGYFFHLGPDPVSTTFRGRLFAKKDASNNLAFGLSKAATSDPNVAFTPFSFSLNTTYLIVVKYSIVDGGTNDTVSLYVSLDVPANEPGSPNISAPDVTATDINPGTVSLRQGSTTTHPTLKVDGIRVGTSWASVTTGTAAPVQHVVDFDGNGRTDFAVVRNTGGGSAGQLTWFIDYNGSAATDGVAWGLASDTIVPVDYDGDDKTDVAIWRTGAPGEAGFYILQSADATFRFEQFGQSGDNAVVAADYDGDGKADPAVYREGAQSVWYYRGSLSNPGGNVTFIPWGTVGDTAAPGDYDGDGRSDFVIRRNNGGGQGVFWLNQTTAGVSQILFGAATDTIVPGDYDGDAKTDLATTRTLGGQINWFVRPSSTGVVSGGPTAVFGTTATDSTAQGDYDGDGKTDFAIWRSTGQFWYFGSTSGTQVVQWGLAGDSAAAHYNSH